MRRSVSFVNISSYLLFLFLPLSSRWVLFFVRDALLERVSPEDGRLFFLFPLPQISMAIWPFGYDNSETDSLYFASSLSLFLYRQSFTCFHCIYLYLSYLSLKLYFSLSLSLSLFFSMRADERHGGREREEEEEEKKGGKHNLWFIEKNETVSDSIPSPYLARERA